MLELQEALGLAWLLAEGHQLVFQFPRLLLGQQALSKGLGDHPNRSGDSPYTCVPSTPTSRHYGSSTWYETTHGPTKWASPCSRNTNRHAHFRNETQELEGLILILMWTRN